MPRIKTIKSYLNDHIDVICLFQVIEAEKPREILGTINGSRRFQVLVHGLDNGVSIDGILVVYYIIETFVFYFILFR